MLGAALPLAAAAMLDAAPDAQPCSLVAPDLDGPAPARASGLVDLSGCDLRGRDLAGARLWAARLGGARLDGANLRGADLRLVDLSGASLRGADLRHADLSSARLSGTDLEGVRWDGAVCPNEALATAKHGCETASSLRDRADRR
jgi:uncharacterized protein YjbI with pentapeptide repeats